MINAEKLLGGLLRQAIGGGRRRGGRRRRRSGLGALLGGSSWKGAAGLGLLGVAFAAYDHFTQKNAQAAAPAAQPPPPPPPAAASGAAAPPPPPAAVPSDLAHRNAILLLQAMIAAASADGRIDPEEEAEILDKLGQAGLSLEEREFLLRQMASPPSLESIAAKVDSPELARQVYAVSLLAVEIDTPAEEEHLSRLRAQLNLDEATVRALHQEFGPEEQ